MHEIISAISFSSTSTAWIKIQPKSVYSSQFADKRFLIILMEDVSIPEYKICKNDDVITSRFDN